MRKVLGEEGCTNKIAAKGMGYADESGPRCELAVRNPEEVATIEANVLAEAKAEATAETMFDLTFAAISVSVGCMCMILCKCQT